MPESEKTKTQIVVKGNYEFVVNHPDVGREFFNWLESMEKQGMVQIKKLRSVVSLNR